MTYVLSVLLLVGLVAVYGWLNRGGVARTCHGCHVGDGEDCHSCPLRPADKSLSSTRPHLT
jgi:hypothetical protein